MFQTHRIASLDLPELSPYRTLKRPLEHREQGIFVAEGDKVVHRLLTSKLEIVSVLLSEQRLPEFELALHNRTETFSVFLATDRRVLEDLIGFEMFQGVLAVAKTPPPFTLNELLDATPSPRLLVAADGLTNAENIGLLARNCAAFDVQALIVGETCASPFLRRAVRNSMGTIFDLPVIESGCLASSLGDLRTRGVRCIAAHPRPDRRTLSQADFTTDCCIVFGAEGGGISPGVLAVCDEAVAIPMASNVDSLNVTGAAAVFLYEAQQQRTRQSK